MSMSPAAVRTARRNLVLRIERFIRSIEGGAQPTADQMTNFREALAALEAGHYSVGEDAIFLAEKGFKPRSAPVSTDLSIVELVARFERLRTENE